MRTKVLAVLAVVILVTVAALAINPSRPAQARAAVCADATFMNGLGADFASTRDAAAKVDMTKPADVAKQAILVFTLRQKYEDMTVSPDCLGSQLIVIAYLANAGDS